VEKMIFLLSFVEFSPPYIVIFLFTVIKVTQVGFLCLIPFKCIPAYAHCIQPH
jgi:hypothetical protein